MISHRQQISRERAIEKDVLEHSLNFSRAAVLSSLIRAWCYSNQIPLELAERGMGLAQALAHSPADDLHLRLVGRNEAFDLKDVEVALETLIGAERKRTEGAVYTPEFVIDALINRCLDLWTKEGKPQKPPLLLDPACGSGGFLVRAIPALSDRFDIKPEQVLREFICGVDVDADSVEHARLILELFCLQNHLPIPQEFKHLLCADTLLVSPSELKRALRLDEQEITGFDVVVANPPYVKIQNLDLSYRAQLNRAFPEFTTGSFNLSQLFLVNGHRLLSASGILGAITPNNLFTSVVGEEVRDYLQRNRCVHSVVDFGHQKIFRNASAYTCLLFLDRLRNDHLLYAQCPRASETLPQLADTAFSPVEVHSLRKEKWRLAPAHHLRNIERLERCGTPLGVLADIRVGFATLKDSVFLLNDSTAHTAIESGITTPAIKIASFSSENEMSRNHRRLIRPYFKKDKRWLAYSENELRERFPVAYAHLSEHREVLEARDKGKKGLKPFFEWGRTQGMEANGPKLLTKTFNRSPQFFLDETDSLFCNGYSIKPRLQSGLFSTVMNAEVLQKILNSHVMNYYVRLTSVGIDGDYWCYQKNFIEGFCIPDISIETAKILFLLDGEELQHFICRIFGLNYCEVEEVVCF
jgi:hypothetical protein